MTPGVPLLSRSIRSRAVHRLSAAALSAVALLGVLVPAAPQAHADSWTQPGFLRTIGGRGEAGVYAWGMAYNPVSNEILVGDYWNFKIRRFDLQGHELGAFFRPPSARKGQPYSISVDGRPGHGDIYVSEISDGKPAGYFARYDKAGNYIGEFQSGARYTAWHTIDGHYLYVADSHYWDTTKSPPQIRKYDLDSNDAQVFHFGTYGTTPNTGQMKDVRGLAVDSGGRIYVDDTTGRTVHVFDSNGTFLYDFGSAGNGLGQFTGDLRGITINKATGEIYVVDAEAGEIEKFQMSGSPASIPPTPVLHWGSVGTGPGQTADGGRAITLDASGNVWLADYGNYRFIEYSPGGTLLATYPNPAEPPAPGGFSEVRDVTVDPEGNVWGADSWNNRFQEFASDGTFLGVWGHRNSTPPYGMDYPRGIAADPTNGNVWVADTRDHLIRVYDPDGNYLMTVGNGNDSTSQGSFRWPMDMEFINQGGTEYVWVADYSSCLLKRVDALTGTESKAVSLCNNGVTVDVVNNRMYVVSWNKKAVYTYDLNGNFITKWGSSGTGQCQFSNPWDIDLIGGALYVTDAANSRVEVFTTGGSCIGQWGTKGIGPNQFSSPSGITHDSHGNIYVADAGNDRIQEFSYAVAVPTPGSDTILPSVTLTSPVKNQVLPPSTLFVTGAATDNIGLAAVNVAVKNLSTNQWWDAKDAVWITAKYWNLAGVSSPTPTNTTYSFGFVGVGYGQHYLTQAQAVDTSGNIKIGSTVKFSTAMAPASDTVPPTTAVFDPGNDSVLPAGSITIDGEATDDVALATVEIAIRDKATNLWWNPATASWGSLKWIPATLLSPGGMSSTWSYSWTGDVSGGSYYVQARSTDTSANTDPPPHVFTQFSVG